MIEANAALGINHRQTPEFCKNDIRVYTKPLMRTGMDSVSAITSYYIHRGLQFHKRRPDFSKTRPDLPELQACAA